MAAVLVVVGSVLAGGLAAAGGAPTGSAGPRASQPAFTRTECPFPVPAPLVDGREVRCGTVVVPEDRRRATGRTVTLAVTVLSGVSRPEQDPIVHLIGGPGGSAESFTPIFGESLLRLSRATRREIVLYDQRGTGHSTPFLGCTAAADAGCAEQLTASGIDLSQYTTTQSADDVKDIARALRYDRVNLWGQSYGTFLALQVLRRHPTIVRSSLLESVDDGTSGFAQPASFDNVLDRVADGCAADAGCRRLTPNLNTSFRTVFEALSDAPAQTPIGSLDAAGFVEVVFEMLSNSFGSTQVPLFVSALERGDLDVVATLLTQLAGEPQITGPFATGMQTNVNCAAVAPYDEELFEQLNADVRPEILEVTGVRAFAQFIGTCREWPVPTPSPRDGRPVRSSVPTLLLNGTFDPNTGLEVAQRAAVTLTRSTVVPVAGYGHFPLVRGNPCTEDIYAGWLSRPTAPPDGTCATDADIEFVTSAEEAAGPLRSDGGPGREDDDRDDRTDRTTS